MKVDTDSVEKAGKDSGQFFESYFYLSYYYYHK